MKTENEKNGGKSVDLRSPGGASIFRPGSFPAGWWHAPAMMFGAFGWLAVGVIVATVAVQ